MSFSGSFRALSRSNDVSGNEASLIKGTVLAATGTLTYTSIAANTTQDQTLTVAGASLGDPIILGSPVLVSGLTPSAFVSAANTVAVRLGNETVGAIVPGALVFTVVVVKA